jgi:hypothetical protein
LLAGGNGTRRGTARAVVFAVIRAAFKIPLGAQFRAAFNIAPDVIIGLAGDSHKEKPPLAVTVAGILALAVAGSSSLYALMTRSLRNEAAGATVFYAGVFVSLAFLARIWTWPNLHDATVLAAIAVLGLPALLALSDARRVAPAWNSAAALPMQAFYVAVALVASRGDVLRRARFVRGLGLPLLFAGRPRAEPRL